MASAPVSARTWEFASVPPLGILGSVPSLPRSGSLHLSPIESGFASVPSGTPGRTSSRGGRKAFLGDLGSLVHHFLEAPPPPSRAEAQGPGGHRRVHQGHLCASRSTTHNQHRGLSTSVIFAVLSGLVALRMQADAGGFVNLIAVLKCTEPPLQSVVVYCCRCR